MYTEIIFPEKDIHFIAINDGVDSTVGTDDFTPFRNIINEWYAKDTSKKVRAVKKAKGMAGDISTYIDADTVSAYAVTAMQWAVGTGLITGKDNNTLSPQSGVTRAETAAMLARFVTHN